MFDCIVVGAGPAGSAAAYQLARSGQTVLLLEKASLPRYKPCTGAVSPIIADWFDFDFGPAIDQRLRRLRYTWQQGDVVEAQLTTSAPIWVVKRHVFDHFLVEQASRQGAEVKDNTPVTGLDFQGDSWQVNTSTGSYAGRYLIAADGAEGPMARWLGFPDQKLRQAAVLEVELPQLLEDSAINFEFGSVKHGCLWNFPKRQGYSLGVAAFLGNELKNSEAALAQYATAFGITLLQGQVYAHGLKLWNGNQPLHTQRALLVGEAAAIVDPLTAEGIRPAIWSGLKAAAAIEQALSGQSEALATYTQTIHASWGEDMQWAQRIAALFYRFPKVGYRVGLKRPSATERMGQLLAGDIRYGDIANRVIKRLSGSFIPGKRD